MKYYITAKNQSNHLVIMGISGDFFTSGDGPLKINPLNYINDNLMIARHNLLYNIKTKKLIAIKYNTFKIIEKKYNVFP